jgi:hypothetical protein
MTFRMKTCVICPVQFTRPTGISTKVWNARQCCSKTCSHILRQKPDALKRSVKRRVHHRAPEKV